VLRSESESQNCVLGCCSVDYASLNLPLRSSYTQTFSEAQRALIYVVGGSQRESPPPKDLWLGSHIRQVREPRENRERKDGQSMSTHSKREKPERRERIVMLSSGNGMFSVLRRLNRFKENYHHHHTNTFPICTSLFHFFFRRIYGAMGKHAMCSTVPENTFLNGNKVGNDWFPQNLLRFGTWDLQALLTSDLALKSGLTISGMNEV